MTVESATFINQLDPALPTNTDLISEGDDHLRKIKSTLQNTFPNVVGAIVATHVELNRLTGVTGNVQIQINTKVNRTGDAYTGGHDFSGAVVTVAEPPPGDNSQKPATTAFVVSTAFAAALPVQTGNNGKILATDGVNAGWVDAQTTHVHTTAQVTGLDAALAGKASSVHSHTMAQVTGLDNALAGKANLTGATFTGAVTVPSLYSQGEVTAFSDARLKTDVLPIEGALEKVCALAGVTYLMKGGDDKRRIGLIAQNVLDVSPEAVHEVDGYLSVAYGNLVGLLVEAVKELRAELRAKHGH